MKPDIEFSPKADSSSSSKLDISSILLLNAIFKNTPIDCTKLQIGGTTSNIDGYITLTDNKGKPVGKFTVQVKHLTYSEKKDGSVFYDIPMYLYAYAERHKGELVFFIACDEKKRKFYWRNIDTNAINEFKHKSEHIQTKARYYFKNDEKCSRANVVKTIELWHKLYKKKMASIKDDKELAEQFAARQLICFDSISDEIQGVSNSHIIRHQVKELASWIDSVDGENNKRICLLVGNAGVGKSAILKDLIDSHRKDDIKLLCIKADHIDDVGNQITLEKLHDTLTYYSIEKHKVILIIDQIDALSQSLTNDRKHLNMIMSILSSLTDHPNIHAIVSCRKYDLEYDSELNKLKDKSTIINVGELTEIEVLTSLAKIEEGLQNKVDKVTVKILRTVQNLNSFAILYQRNKSHINFNSQIELYDALWDNIILCSAHETEIEKREYLAYKIADTVKQSGTLNPLFTPATRQKRAYDYLSSSGILKRDGKSVSFFHQSFYEYTLARNYSEKDKLFANDLKKEIQGLEIRSTVKAVLDFKRGHEIAKFIDEAKVIIFTPKIRLHLKLLVLSVLAFVENPSREEKALLVDIAKADKRLLEYFLRGVSSQAWFPTLKKLLREIMSGFTDGRDKLFLSTISCLSRYVFNNTEEVYGLIDLISDKATRSFAIECTIRQHNDYSKACVHKAYEQTKVQNAIFAVDMISDALKSNKEFALSEAEEMIQDFLLSNNQHNKYSQIEELCSILCTNYSIETLGLLHRCICKTIKNTAVEGYWGFTATEIFNGITTNDDVEKLLRRYEDLLTNNAENKTIARPLIEELLELNNETTLCMAFNAMAAAPTIYNDIIYQIFVDDIKISNYNHSDLEFYLLRMFKSWYKTLSTDKSEWCQNRLLSFKGEDELIHIQTKNKDSVIYPNLWREKWKLICNILPENSFTPEMKKCYQELMRRFGKKLIIKEPNYSVTMGVPCTGIVDDTTYAKWTLSNWLNSFKKLEEHKWINGRFISLSEHAEAFKKIVTSTPDKFYDFILGIQQNKNIPEMYKIAGLEGLFAGGIDASSLWELTKPYMNEDFATKNPFKFRQIAEHFIQDDNEHIGTIFLLCKKLAISPNIEPSTFFPGQENKSTKEKATHMLNTGCNSFQGEAAQVLVKMSKIPSYRSKIYGFFTDNALLINECVLTVPLHYLSIMEYYDEELYFTMLNSMLQHLGTEALFIQAITIQYGFYYRYDQVKDYVNKIESDSSCHSLLCQIYFYGSDGEGNTDECQNRLEKLLSLNNEEVIAKIVEISMKAYDKDKYHNISKTYLERFATDKRDEVVKSYFWFCNELPIEAFPWYINLIKNIAFNSPSDIHFQLGYIKRCISNYPTDCYRFISSQNYLNSETSYFNNEIVFILLEIYKKLKLDEDEDAMNEVLDLIDEYIYQDNTVINNALTLLA